ncbi:polyprenyl synthetase family protein [Pseudomonas capeferrum]|uniref:polyprenyl synthetase family protein n=1 Tax=Pseudomonas capeferrum TaxID=1495066 RepID=UPI002158D9CC|nr:polyprenyl synthetase family protein [Pseudomonas capeferrum]
MSATIDPGIDEHLASRRAVFEKRLEALLPPAGNERELVVLAMREGALAPGKRLRPLLLMLATEGLGGPFQAALDLGCAVEMVHAASLVLDDMPCMDNAQLRRGRATVHLAFGEDVAILTAVALLSRAFGVVAAIDSVSAEVRNQLVASLATAIGNQGLVQGQFEDLRQGKAPRNADEIAVTNSLKTGALFAAVLDMACLISSARGEVCHLLNQFADELGQAFQLYDDLRDRDPASGKDQGKDQGKSTLVSLCGEAKVCERLQRHLAQAEACLSRAIAPDDTLARFVQAMFAKALKR